MAVDEPGRRGDGLAVGDQGRSADEAPVAVLGIAGLGHGHAGHGWHGHAAECRHGVRDAHGCDAYNDHAHVCHTDHDHGCGHHHHGDHDHPAGGGCGCAHDGCSCGHDHHHHDDGCHDDAAEARELSASPTFAWRVTGLDCPSCARETEGVVAALAGVADARLVYATATLEVVAVPGADRAALRHAVLDAVRSRGQDLALSPEEEAELDAAPSWWRRHRETVLMGASGAFLAMGLVAEHLLANELVAVPLYVISAVLGLVFVAPMAVASLARRTADMNVLMAVAVIGGLVLGFSGDTSTFADAAVVIFLDQVGEWLEGWSMRRTAGSVASLMELAPDVAHVVGEGASMVDVPSAEVAVGERVRVLPGERVPLDGSIVSGASAFNEAAVTGEPLPADKGVDDAVFAGSLNTSGVVDVTVTAPASNSTLARVVAQVQGAQAAKAPYESFVDRFAAAYTPVVVGAAVVVGLVVPTALSVARGPDAALWYDWAYRALSLLVVACPCALVISTPVTFVSAITRAARDGVLVKGGAAFDVASRVTDVALDKTGTLTTGRPAVTIVAPTRASDETDVLGTAFDEVLTVAAALEATSTHPLARAVVDEAARRGIRGTAMPVAADVVETVAAGVSGTVEGVACAIGKPAFVLAGVRDADVERMVADVSATGATTLVVVSGGHAIGVIGVADALRDEAAPALASLHRMGIATTMLTGDHVASASAVARALDVTSFAAGLLPADKVAQVRRLQEGGVIAMVGDGINDAPALATADLGITMGAAASDTALDVADVALLGDDLSALPRFLALARRAMRTVRANIAFAIVVKAAVFAAVVAGVAGMGAAVFADTGVALLVILNGMRLMLGARRP